MRFAQILACLLLAGVLGASGCSGKAQVAPDKDNFKAVDKENAKIEKTDQLTVPPPPNK
jgi:hypothetical protein